MRYATVTLQWEAGDVHPIDAVFARADDVSVEAIRYVSPGPEGRYVELLELGGDLDRARALLADSPAALEYDVAGPGATASRTSSVAPPGWSTSFSRRSTTTRSSSIGRCTTARRRARTATASVD